MNFQLLKIYPENILSILTGLKPFEEASIDNLSCKFLKNFNLSINSTPFQEVAKLLKLNYFFKKALRPILKTNCHISLLPLLSQTIERIVHDQTDEFLSKNKILYRLRVF